MAGKPGRGGMKGRSGRKSRREEMHINELYKLSTKTVMDFLEKKNVPEEKRVKIAIEIVKKAMPQKVDLGGQKDNPLEVKVNFKNMSTEDIGRWILDKLKG